MNIVRASHCTDKGVMMCSYGKSRDDGVSPVVGVMLMLVVVIIIAAVVSGFAGSLTKGQERVPTAAIDVTIKNSGSYASSYFLIQVKSVSDPILSQNLRIVTSYLNSTGGIQGMTIAKSVNAPNTKYSTYKYQALLGYGPGVTNWTTSGQPPSSQEFGNYTITAGTTMKASPQGYVPSSGTGYGYGAVTPYVYTEGEGWSAGQSDSMMAVLGKLWYELRPGDTVKVTIIDIPSGKTLFNKNVPVVG